MIWVSLYTIVIRYLFSKSCIALVHCNTLQDDCNTSHTSPISHTSLNCANQCEAINIGIVASGACQLPLASYQLYTNHLVIIVRLLSLIFFMLWLYFSKYCYFIIMIIIIESIDHVTSFLSAHKEGKLQALLDLWAQIHKVSSRCQKTLRQMAIW